MSDGSSKQPIYESDAGWSWFFPPIHKPAKATRIVWAGNEGVMMAESHETGMVGVHLAYSEPLPVEKREYRGVAFDIEGKRYLLKGAMSGSSKGENIETTMRYFVGEEDDAPSFDKLVYFGIEAKTK